jgi:hypothetical protein
MRKYMDEALTLIKNMQKNQESSIFKSITERFREEPAGSSPIKTLTTHNLGNIGGIGEDKYNKENSSLFTVTGAT